VINRGKLVTEELPPNEDNRLFKRYEFTEDGVSPRVLPGAKHGIHHVTGVEHDQEGRPSENALNREKMMDKRLGKISKLRVTDAVKADAPNANPDLLIVAMGSTGGTIEEARARLTTDGIKTNQIMVRQMHPFPVE
jgi:2-oxoglutarate ferredoxin oxidoreductase subunit alpha